MEYSPRYVLQVWTQLEELQVNFLYTTIGLLVLWTCRRLLYFHQPRTLDKEELKATTSLQKLADFSAETVFEIYGSSKVNTVNGEAVVVDLETEKNGNDITGSMIIPDRYKRKIIGNIPIIAVYNGKRRSKNNKDYHDIKLVSPNKRGVSTKRPRKKEEEEETLATFSDDDGEVDEENEVEDDAECGQDSECRKNGNACNGFCPMCKNHQPYNGGQCKCVLKRRRLFY